VKRDAAGRKEGQSCSRLSRTGDGWVAGTPAHVAQEVNADELGVVIDKLSHLLHFLDDNGWTPLHVCQESAVGDASS
jgi:hypothetical protein